MSKDKKDEIFHSSGYARAQNGQALGSSSLESFEKRRQIDQNRTIVKGYGDSRVVNDLGKEAARLNYKTQRELAEKREAEGSRFGAKRNEKGSRFGAKDEGKSSRFGVRREESSSRFAVGGGASAEAKRAAMTRKNPGISR